MNKKWIIILIIMFLTGCSYDVYEMPDDVYINVNKKEFVVYEKHTTFELIGENNVEILSEDALLDTNEIGQFKYTLEYKYKRRKYKYDINYSVIDNVKPIFILASNNITMSIDDDNKNLCKLISYGDNYDNDPICMVNGNYNVDKIGTYNNLEFIIVDSSGNINQKEFSLNIVNKISNKNNYNRPSYIYIDEILNNYKRDNTSVGIDVSKWQGNVDFSKVKDAGIEFVIMRIGSQRDPNNTIEMDTKFKEYLQGVKQAGLKFGVYIYNTAISIDDGINTANWIIDNLDGEKLDFPVAFDWEDWENFNKYKISIHTLNETYKAFEQTLNKNGYKAMLYSSKNFLERVWNNFDDSNIWLAHYTKKTDYKGRYMMWQMTSLAKINGITDNTVDIDIFYK